MKYGHKRLISLYLVSMIKMFRFLRAPLPDDLAQVNSLSTKPWERCQQLSLPEPLNLLKDQETFICFRYMKLNIQAKQYYTKILH